MFDAAANLGKKSRTGSERKRSWAPSQSLHHQERKLHKRAKLIDVEIRGGPAAPFTLFHTTGLRDRFSIRAFGSSASPHENPPWDFPDPVAAWNSFGPSAENSSGWPRLRAVHREVLVRHPSLLSRERHGRLQKFPGHLRFQQPVPIFAEHRRVPHRVVQIQPHKPAEQYVVVHLLHQQTLAAHRIEHLQQLRAQELFGRNRRPARFRVHLVELRRKLFQDLVNHRADRSQRMNLAHPKCS